MGRISRAHINKSSLFIPKELFSTLERVLQGRGVASARRQTVTIYVTSQKLFVNAKVPVVKFYLCNNITSENITHEFESDKPDYTTLSITCSLSTTHITIIRLSPSHDPSTNNFTIFISRFCYSFFL